MPQEDADSIWFASPLNRVYALQLNCKDCDREASSVKVMPRQRFLSYLERTTSLRSLALVGWSLCWVQFLLLAPLRADSASGDHSRDSRPEMLNMSLALETLKLTFKPRLCRERSEDAEGKAQSDVEALLQLLQEWMERCRSLQTVELRGWGKYFTDAHAELLKLGVGTTLVKIIR